MNICFPQPARMIPYLISFALLFSSGCMHIIHPSNIDPGWSADVMGGVGREHYHANVECGGCFENEPDSQDVNIIQLGLAWGKRLENGDALRAGLIVPLSMNNGSALGAMGGTTLDIYYQFMDGRFDAGFGGLVNLASSGIYLEAGKRFNPSKGLELNFDAGVSAEFALFNEPGIRLFSLAGVSTGRWRLGIWADYLKYRDYLKRCDENCETDDFLERSFSGGFYLGRSF